MSIWVARRSKTKQTWPDVYDQTVAGGIAAKASPLESVVREAMEEASLEADFVLDRIRAGGVISYTTRTRPVGWWQPCVLGHLGALTLQRNAIRLRPALRLGTRVRRRSALR